jgi:hypothetical protein
MGVSNVMTLRTLTSPDLIREGLHRACRERLKKRKLIIQEMRHAQEENG